MIREQHLTVRGVEVFRCRHTDPILKARQAGPFYIAPQVFGLQRFRTEAEIIRRIRNAKGEVC
jgi:hypothetical protein